MMTSETLLATFLMRVTMFIIVLMMFLGAPRCYRKGGISEVICWEVVLLIIFGIAFWIQWAASTVPIKP